MYINTISEEPMGGSLTPKLPAWLYTPVVSSIQYYDPQNQMPCSRGLGRGQHQRLGLALQGLKDKFEIQTQ